MPIEAAKRLAENITSDVRFETLVRRRQRRVIPFIKPKTAQEES